MLLLCTVNYNCTGTAAANFPEEVIVNIRETPTAITMLWIITVSLHSEVIKSGLVYSVECKRNFRTISAKRRIISSRRCICHGRCRPRLFILYEDVNQGETRKRNHLDAAIAVTSCESSSIYLVFCKRKIQHK